MFTSNYSTVIVRKIGLRNWMALVTSRGKSLALLLDIHGKAMALREGVLLRNEIEQLSPVNGTSRLSGDNMGMQDNPLIGEYTKGISKGSGVYLRKLEQRLNAEKASLKMRKLVATDLQNSFQIVQNSQSVKATLMANKQEKAPVAPLRVSKKPLPKKEAKGSWKAVKLDELATIWARKG